MKNINYTKFNEYKNQKWFIDMLADIIGKRTSQYANSVLYLPTAAGHEKVNLPYLGEDGWDELSYVLGVIIDNNPNMNDEVREYLEGIMITKMNERWEDEKAKGYIK